jgi:hypothetical protein
MYHFVRFEAFTAVRIMMFFWVLAPFRLVNVSKKHPVSIFRTEVAKLGSGGIYIGLGLLQHTLILHFAHGVNY